MIKSKYIAKILAKMRIPSFDRCNIDKTCKVNYESVLAKVKMGRYSYVGARTSITAAQIGSFCSIGGQVSIGGGVHPTNMVSTSPVFLNGKNFFRKNYASFEYEPSKTVIIGNDVWIGDGVYIKAGVRIGSGAIIGAHAVVTKDVEPYSVVIGIPAQELRKRFDDDIVKKLLEIKWWDWPEGKLRGLGECFNDPEILIAAAEKWERKEEIK